MPKALLVLVILFAAGIGFVVYLAAKSVMGDPSPAPEVKQPDKSADKGGLIDEDTTKRAKALLDKTTRTVKRTASDAANALQGPVIQLKVADSPIIVRAGTPKEVKISRDNDPKLGPLQLEFVPAAGAKLKVKGGAFRKGARETTFTVEAESGGQDASLIIKAGERARIVVPVRMP